MQHEQAKTMNFFTVTGEGKFVPIDINTCKNGDVGCHTLRCSNERIKLVCILRLERVKPVLSG